MANVSNGTRPPRREDGYSTIGAVRREIADPSAVTAEDSAPSNIQPPPPSDMPATDPNYENIELG